MGRAIMTFAPFTALGRRLARLASNRDGVSAVEFAMLLPIMITLYFGTVEITQGLSIDRKVTLAARVASDLVTQAASIDTAGVNGVFQAATSMIVPYPTGSALKVTITAVSINAQGQATVAWSDTLNGTAKTVGNPVTLPTGLVVNNTQLIWSEVEYSYTPAVGYVITGSIPLKDQIYMRPRLSDKVCRDGIPCT
jgi:Flp pilus assembly protein TadG